MSASMLPRDARGAGQAPRRLPAAGVRRRRRRARVRPRSRRHRRSRRRSRFAAIRRRRTSIGARRWCSTASSSSACAIALDGKAVADDRLVVTPSTLTLRDAPDAGTLTMRSVIAPSRNVALEGLYVSSGVFCTQCEPEGFRRITYFPDRPDVLARYDVTLRADRARYPQLLSNGNLVARRAARRRSPLRDDGTTRSRSRPTCSRWSRATSRRSTTRSSRRRAARVALRDLLDAGQPRRAAATRWSR